MRVIDRKYIRLIPIILQVLNMSCTGPVKDERPPIILSDTLSVIRERDLIPEGTAYDPNTHLVFISSMYKRKIVAIEPSGRYYDFVDSGEDDLWGTLGMAVDSIRNQLWVISTKGKPLPAYPEITDDRWQSRLYSYDIPTEKLVGIFEPQQLNNEEIGFNDLTLAKNGDVYITESINNKIYVLKYGSRHIEMFLKLTDFTFPNGITFAEDNKALFVSCTEGLLKINVATKTYQVLKSEFTTLPQPIDGLAFFENSLIGHHGSVIRQFFLDDSLDSIIRQKIVDDQNLNSSTTGEVGSEGWYYYIANSQIRSGVDYANKRIKPLDSLQDVIIKRRKLGQAPSKVLQNR